MTTITTPAPFSPPASGRRVRGRTAWFVAGFVLALTSITFAVFDVVSAFAFARVHFTTTITEPVRSLEVHANAGSVHVIASADTATTSVVAGKGTRGLVAPKHPVTFSNGRLVVSTNCVPGIANFCNMNLTITVPASAVLDLSSSGGGVTVDGPFGDVHASSSGGDVRVRGAHGQLSLDSSGGGVRAQQVTSAIVDASSSGGGVNLEFLAPPETVHASSSGGGVTVTVPQTDDAYQVHASSSGGSVHTQVRTDPSGSRVINASSSGGGVTIQYPQT
jgi:hypothetical protein